MQNIEAEKFILLVACSNQDIKIYNLNDWKFEESEVQFTEGALGKGVANMRIYQENDNSYLGKFYKFYIFEILKSLFFFFKVIANELMTDTDINVFLPIFKHDEQANILRQQIIDWTSEQLERLNKIDINNLQKAVEVLYIIMI